MPRNARVDVGDEIYHVINRSNGRYQIFNTKKEYRIFVKELRESDARDARSHGTMPL